MKYYLIIGYQLLEKNKNFPTIRVYINGQMIDEFECDNEQATKISTKCIIDRHLVAEYFETKVNDIRTYEYQTTKKYKVFEVDSSSWPDQGDLVLEVLNNKSDYNNGFMRNRSLVSFDVVFLIRKDIYDSKSTMYNIIKKFLTTLSMYNLDWYPACDSPRWPGVTKYPGFVGLGQSRRENNIPKGGDFKKKFTIKKKHKMHMLVLENVETKGYFCIDRFFLAWYQYYSKNYFDLVIKEEQDLDGGKSKIKVEIKEINTNNED
jgi:hypothetical protein